MKVQPSNNIISFKSISFQDYNYKFNNLRDKLKTETEKFFEGKNNVSKIGEGVGGETYKFTDSDLRNFVIKTTKPNYKDNYEKEYKNLMSLPIDKIGGQEAIARAYDSSKSKYALITTFVEGKPVSLFKRYNEAYLNSLFDKMFELDKAGIYHGDLNGNNILLNNSNKVNFIDYQWTQIVPKHNFYDNEKMKKMLLPRNVFPENAQMFEMAFMPYYIENGLFLIEKESFLKKYLKAKALYHEKRAKYIEKLIPKWYSSEQHLIRQSLKEEKAKSVIYRNPDESVLKLELKKLQFLSDYRDAYSHVDANLPNRNIIPSSSSYLCAMSAVQDFRKDVYNALSNCTNSDKKEYLLSLKGYGDYWYSNLSDYTSSTFNYVMRALTNKPSIEESKHRFYINERNPRQIRPNRDLLQNMGSTYQTTFDKNFEVPYNMSAKISDTYDDASNILENILNYDKKSRHNIDKIKSVSKESKNFNLNETYLDLLNVSQVGVLKIREFYSYVRHNISSYNGEYFLENLLEKSINFTDDLFNHIFYGLRGDSSNNILTQGYKSMRKFKTKI